LVNARFTTRGHGAAGSILQPFISAIARCGTRAAPRHAQGARARWLRVAGGGRLGEVGGASQLASSV